MLLDLDRFKAVNDTFGHDMGDELLKAVSERLKTCVREVDTVARMGGDEFTIILEGISSEQNILVVAKRITESIATPFELKGHHISVGISIGITIYPHDDHPVDELLKHADTAMYQSETARRQCVPPSRSRRNSLGQSPPIARVLLPTLRGIRTRDASLLPVFSMSTH